MAKADSQIAAEARQLDTRELVEKHRVACAQAADFRAQAKEEEDSWWTDDDRVADLQATASQWERWAGIYAAELAVRRETKPDETGQAERVVDAERKQRQERYEASIAETEKEFAQSINPLHRLGQWFGVVSGVGANALTWKERATGLARLAVAVGLLGVAIYLAIRSGRISAERGRQMFARYAGGVGGGGV